MVTATGIGDVYAGLNIYPERWRLCNSENYVTLKLSRVAFASRTFAESFKTHWNFLFILSIVLNDKNWALNKHVLSKPELLGSESTNTTKLMRLEYAGAVNTLDPALQNTMTPLKACNKMLSVEVFARPASGRPTD
ncbi:hypothetical protein BaRGS_00034384 [Batillaria attramentaria]|uniref:Uncharacterized protein n=1 Tax=Batillaria attramentaria TaxID=370345 RepID=A0ABD0JHJ3_9CAEN